jgi:hypothetical protein
MNPDGEGCDVYRHRSDLREGELGATIHDGLRGQAHPPREDFPLQVLQPFFPLLRIRIEGMKMRILIRRIRMFLGLPDPDPLSTAPDPSLF